MTTTETGTFDVIAWMFEHGHTGYAREIEDLRCTRDEIIGEAGRYWQFCEFTRRDLAKIDRQIEEVERAARDRYQDWATDNDF